MYHALLALTAISAPGATLMQAGADTERQPATVEVAPRPAADDARPAYFYHGYAYGSDASAGPLETFLNKAYALSINERRNKKIFDYNYGFEGVLDAVAHPGDAIERGGGWWRFLRTEVLPLTPNPSDAKWYTNYTGHVIEGGIYARRLREWFEARGVPLAGLWSGLVTSAAAVWNEFYENTGATRGSAATVADLYVFDLAGILLFTHDGVARFFSGSLRANVWPGQATLTLPDAALHNNASRLVVKFPWGPFPGTSLFYWSGIGAQGGLTFHRSDGLDVSVAVGPDARSMRIDPVTGEETVDLELSAGMFVDRNGSLLANVHVSQVEDRMVAVNVYPGVLPLAGGSFGAWMNVGRDLTVRFGITNRFGPGVGFGWGR